MDTPENNTPVTKGKENERKFLLSPKELLAWLNFASGSPHEVAEITQGYLVQDEDSHLRVRIKKSASGTKCSWTFKKETEDMVQRDEEEGELSIEQAQRMMGLAKSRILKQRTSIPFKGQIFQLDRFYGKNEGVFIMEIEMKTKNGVIEWPENLPQGQEVTCLPKYRNINMSTKAPPGRSNAMDSSKKNFLRKC